MSHAMKPTLTIQNNGWTRIRHSLFPPLNPPITDWHNRRVWLIGASSGIGAATAHALYAAGASIALSARSTEGLNTLKTQLIAQNVNHSNHPSHSNHPNRLIVAPCDVTDTTQVTAAWQHILHTWGDCDVVLFLAGTYTPMGATAWQLDTANQMLTINLQGCIHVLDQVMPHMLAHPTNKHIAITSSVAGYRGLPRALIYSATKSALNTLSESLWLDLHPKGIGVSRICPGFVATPLTAKNDFAMPCMITPEQAAHFILTGLAQGQFEIDFPKRFTLVMRLLALLPHRWYFNLMSRLMK
jgi:NADP-dependent 3-hydroxy acid dehydrogenase YdfG